MEDKNIIQLFFERSETAITETATKYGKLCHTIAYNILYNEEDSEECVNDTYARAWGCIPPKKPTRLGAFLGKIARNISLDRYNKHHAKKRGGQEIDLVFEELEGVISSSEGTEIVDELHLKSAINSFLEGLDKEKRIIFFFWPCDLCNDS